MNEFHPSDSPLHGYAQFPAELDLPAIDRDVLAFWSDQRCFARSLEQTSDGRSWTFYEGPPTANGLPGTHHIEARVFKDIFPRFKTMQGRRVDRRAGWDCHGLPVELAVERELGFNGKADIERYGIEAFNQRCRESVQRHVGAFSELTERMGYWVNLDEAYQTMRPDYIESVWWALKTIFAAGLLVEDYRVAPYCPRCGTGLSDHELAQGYETVADPSAYVRFPVSTGPLAGRASLLVWTTTPWTLPSNALVAVRADFSYVVATDGRESLIVAAALRDRVLGEDWKVLDAFPGSAMVGWGYQPPFDLVAWPGRAHFVVAEDYVTAEDGTGIVHQAPAFGTDDFESCRRNGVKMVNPIGSTGRFLPEFRLVGGMSFIDANDVLLDDLQRRELLLRSTVHEHSYPHCWRCHSRLLYYAQPAWYIRTTQRKSDLVLQNERTAWYPKTVKWGRYGDWLKNNVDWALSRQRYWGTPLPLWRNSVHPDRVMCVGSLAELSELVGQELSDLDPHRPFIDDLNFTVPGVEGEFRRVPDVIDAWFDSGSMPFAQWGYPWVPGSEISFDQAYPADFICEAIDQTRGWFYTLMAVGTLVFGQSPYRNVVCLGHILAEDGRKMSKHLGNVLEPIPLLDQHGADPVRWFMAAGGSPWSQRRVGHQTIAEIVRKVFLTYWNTVLFQVLYARACGWFPTDGISAAPADRPVVDRWLVSARNVLVRDVTAALEDFDTQRTGVLLGDFVDDLSNWYVRRSRRRFWSGDPAAFSTLHETLDVLTRLMAPLAPFVTERVWQGLVVAVDPQAPGSVHLGAWPTVDETAIDEGLQSAMQLTRRLVELGRAARAEAKLKTRQPLQRALISRAAYARLDPELRAEIAAELNLEALEAMSSDGNDQLVVFSAKANFRALGRRYGKRTPIVSAAIAEADAAELARSLAAEGAAEISADLDGVRCIVVTADEVIISERPRAGWSVANDQGDTIALDLRLTPGLLRAGMARDAIRLIQEARKAAGLEVTDRIRLQWSAPEPLAEALTAYAEMIADEVLAIEVVQERHPFQAASVHIEDVDLRLEVSRV